MLGIYPDWKCNIEAVYSKGLTRLYFPSKLRSFNVCTKMLHILYQSVGKCSLRCSHQLRASEPAIRTITLGHSCPLQ